MLNVRVINWWRLRLKKYFRTFRNVCFTTYLTRTFVHSSKRRLNVAASRHINVSRRVSNVFIYTSRCESSWLPFLFFSERNPPVLHGLPPLRIASSDLRLSCDKPSLYIRVSYVIETSHDIRWKQKVALFYKLIFLVSLVFCFLVS